MRITKDIETETVNYQELARRVGDCVLNNQIYGNTQIDGDEWELVNGEDYRCTSHDDEDECNATGNNFCDDEPIEVYQMYIITDRGAEYLKRNTDEIVYYNETLDIYLWGITHYGTSWDYVNTLIKA